MKTRGDILYRLARFLAGVPPDALGAIVLFALTHPGLMGALYAVVLFVLGVLCTAVLFVLKYLVILLIDGIISWYLGKMFMLHAWPRLPRNLQLPLRKVVDRMLLRSPEQNLAADRESESAFSKNSKRHPHW